MTASILSLFVYLTTNMSTPIEKLLDKGPVDRIAHLKTICDALGITTSSKLTKQELKSHIYNHTTLKPESEQNVREMISNINTEAKRLKTDSVSSQASPGIKIPATPPSPITPSRTTVTTTAPTTTTTTTTTTPSTTTPSTTAPTNTLTTTTSSLPTRPIPHSTTTTSTSTSTSTSTTPITQPASQVNLFDISTEDVSVLGDAESMDCGDSTDSPTDPKRKMTEETDEEGLENKDKRIRFEYDNDDIRKLASACSRILNDKEERDKERDKLYKTADQWREIYLNSERRRKKLEVDIEKRNEEISQITDKLHEIKLRLNNLDESAKNLQQQRQQNKQQQKQQQLQKQKQQPTSL